MTHFLALAFITNPMAIETGVEKPPAFIGEVAAVVREFPFSFDMETVADRLSDAVEHALQGKWGKEFTLSNQQRQSIGNAVTASMIEGGDFDTAKLTELVSAIALEEQEA